MWIVGDLVLCYCSVYVCMWGGNGWTIKKGLIKKGGSGGKSEHEKHKLKKIDK